jgi:hypothetical protein
MARDKSRQRGPIRETTSEKVEREGPTAAPRPQSARATRATVKRRALPWLRLLAWLVLCHSSDARPHGNAKDIPIGETKQVESFFLGIHAVPVVASLYSTQLQRHRRMQTRHTWPCSSWSGLSCRVPCERWVLSCRVPFERSARLISVFTNNREPGGCPSRPSFMDPTTSFSGAS